MPHTYTDLPGYGTTLQVKISSTYTTISGVFEISWDGFTVAQRSPTGLTDTRIRKKHGLPNFGTLKCKVYYDPNDSTHQLLRDRIATATPTSALDEFKLIYSDGMTTPANALITGYVSDFSQGGIEPETGTLTADLTIEVDNVSAFTAGGPVV